MHDFLIVGSGFGGSVSALRLVERGCRVLLLEKGRRFQTTDFARSNWDLRRWLWRPRLGCRGPFQMSFLPHLTALSGVGVGGGSLVYANTLEEPGAGFYEAPSWRALADWRQELAPHYGTARAMLGAAPNPRITWADEALGDVARELGGDAQFAPTQVGVFFGAAGVPVPDPYFGGAGPARTGCTHCGACMIGCRVGAKNTLDRNYLHLAEAAGLELRAGHEVIGLAPVPGGWEVQALAGDVMPGRRRRLATFRARAVILAGGVLGSVPLLLRMRARGVLPRLSPRLGQGVRTNSEVLIGVVSRRRDRVLSDGVAITSILRFADGSSVEPVRYPEGSGFFRLLSAPHAPGESFGARARSALARVARQPGATVRTLLVPDLARHSIILLYMRAAEGALALELRGRRLRTRLAEGSAPRASLPEASDIAERVARALDGYPISLATELLFGVPTTAHILGGCGMGASAAEGVIDADHAVYGYDGLYVVDGAAVTANPGVNPSLTIAALAERAVAAWDTRT
ncbi:MAG TPA: FAD-dependent oxidoreductase [Longimicrobiales bacterium]|nr:FAD-dependent oxidoreductase [Longimicrobiales bacterium]